MSPRKLLWDQALTQWEVILARGSVLWSGGKKGRREVQCRHNAECLPKLSFVLIFISTFPKRKVYNIQISYFKPIFFKGETLLQIKQNKKKYLISQ